MLPWFGDIGILFYRTDLLEKYGYDGPPTTWDELEEMATTIMEGEQANNPEFQGFVWQGNAYEGLTCDALEWLASSVAARSSRTARSPLDNDEAKADPRQGRQGWVGGSPQRCHGLPEEDARNVFQGGNAAFMRNWPYAYSLGNGRIRLSPAMFDVAPTSGWRRKRSSRHARWLAAGGLGLLGSTRSGHRVRQVHGER